MDYFFVRYGSIYLLAGVARFDVGAMRIRGFSWGCNECPDLARGCSADPSGSYAFPRLLTTTFTNKNNEVKGPNLIPTQMPDIKPLRTLPLHLAPKIHRILHMCDPFGTYCNLMIPDKNHRVREPIAICNT